MMNNLFLTNKVQTIISRNKKKTIFWRWPFSNSKNNSIYEQPFKTVSFSIGHKRYKFDISCSFVSSDIVKKKLVIERDKI